MKFPVGWSQGERSMELIENINNIKVDLSRQNPWVTRGDNAKGSWQKWLNSLY
jgi:hypothetical protein